MQHTVTSWRRLRWAVRAVLTLGVAASVAANVLHAQDNPISQTISAWPALALLLTIEIVSRIPMARTALAVVRVVATATVASIAAWVSYWHMAAVASTYGESVTSRYLLPLTVDGLVVVCSVSLVELTARIRSVEDRPAEVAELEASYAMPAAPVSPAPTTARPMPVRTSARRGPQPRREAVSPLTGRAL